MSLPGVITGITMVFIPAISTFEISALLGGNKENLIGNIIVMDDGKIVESVKHIELIKKNGMYSKINEIQSKEYDVNNE